MDGATTASPGRLVPAADALPAEGSGAAPSTLHITGAVCISGPDGALTSLASAQAQVAAVRLVRDRKRSGTSRRELAGVIWPEAVPDTWASALRTIVTRVRRFMAEAGVHGAELAVRNGRYVLDLPPDVVVDAERAEEDLARAAQALHTGQPTLARHRVESALTVLTRPFLPEHESEWADDQRNEFADRTVQALELAAQAALGCSAREAAVVHARRAVDLAPLRESAHRTLIRTQLAAGNRAEALASYARLRTTLGDELGIDPSPETELLYIDILGSPEVRAPAAARPLARSTFVGRPEQMRLMQSTWSSLGEGQIGFVVVTGELGIGKSRLLQETGRRIGRTGAAVLYRSCAGSTGAESALCAALQDHLTAFRQDERLDGMRTLVDRAHVRLEEGEDTSHAAAVALLAAALRELGGRAGTALLLDDLELADPVTLATLRTVVAAGATRGRLLIVVSAETPRLTASCMRLLHDLERAAVSRRVNLDGFDLARAHDLVVSLPGAAGLPVAELGRLVEDSGGNPYLLERLTELATAPPAPGDAVDDGVRDYVRIRTADLDLDAQTLLRVASVAGRVFEIDIVGRVARLPGPDAMRAVEELMARGLVRETSTGAVGPRPLQSHGYGFVHGVVRDAVYATICKTDKLGLHAALSEQIATHRAEVHEHYVQDLARHMVTGGTQDRDAPLRRDRDDPLVRTCWQAAARAEQVGDLHQAMALRAEALRAVPPSDVGLRARASTLLGLTQLALGDPVHVDTLSTGIFDGVRAGLYDVAMQAACGLADGLGAVPSMRGEAAAVVDMLLEELAARQADVLADPALAPVLGRFLARQLEHGQSEAPPAFLHRAVDTMSFALGEGLDYEDRQRLAGELWLVAGAAGDPNARALAAHHGASAAAVRGHSDVARTLESRLRSAVGEHPEPRLFAQLLDDMAFTRATSRGDVLGVRAHRRDAPYEGSICEHDLVRRQARVAQWLGFAVSTSRHPGQDEPADVCLDDVLVGRHAAARVRLRRVIHELDDTAPDDALLHSLGILALVAAELGDPVLAERVQQRLEPLGDLVCAHGYRSYAGPASFHLGRLARVRGHFDEAERQLTAALSAVSRSGARTWIAPAQTELAAVLEARGRTGDVEAVTVLRAEARRLRHPLAAVPLQR